MTKIFLAALAVVAITGCSKDNETIDTNSDNRIVFGSSIEATTRAVGDTDTQFNDNDEIGVIGYREDLQKPTTDFSAPFMDKAVFTYGNDKFTSTSADAIWQRGKAYNFYAYYPSNLAINTLTTAAPTATLAVTTGTGIGIDVMHAAQQTAVFNKTVTSAALAFTHSLSKIKFEVKKEDSDTPYSELTTVEFNMANQTGEFNVATGAVANSGGNVVLSKTVAPAQEITTTAVSVLGTEWIVLPSDDISGVKLTINGQQIDATNLTGATTEAGKITTITITVKKVGIDITSSITAWGNVAGSGDIDAPAPAPKVGYYYYSDGTYSATFKTGSPLLGVVYQVNGKNGKLVEVTEGDDLQWGPNTVTTNATNTTEGQANMATIKGINLDYSNHPAFQRCADKNAGGATYWYLPAKDELSAFYTAYNNYGTTAFNALMTATGVNGAEFGSGNYWSSSDYSSYSSWYVNFGNNGYTGNSSKTSATLKTRCVRVF